MKRQRKSLPSVKAAPETWTVVLPAVGPSIGCMLSSGRLLVLERFDQLRPKMANSALEALNCWPLREALMATDDVPSISGVTHRMRDEPPSQDAGTVRVPAGASVGERKRQR